MPSYDAIVLGIGGMGSAALFELSRRGRRVLGLEQFAPGHDRGSSHGHTRVIRQAYYEHPAYVPLARRAYERWYELEQITGRHLFTECGCLNFGMPGSELVAGVRSSAAEHLLPVEELTGSEIEKRWPAFRVPADYRGVYEHRAGFLYVEECVTAHAEAAAAHGAEIRTDEPVEEWKAVGDGVEVRTGKGTYRAARLIVTAGAWATRLLTDIGVPLAVMRQVLHWFAPTDPALFRRDRFPVYISETPLGHYYGLPAIDPRGHKAARHYGAPELATPDAVNWSTGPDDADPVRGFLRAHLPGADGPPTFAQVCMYTLSPDRHFVIDRHPMYPQVAVAAGFSGHGFKFASAVGEVLADLSDGTPCRQDMSFFRAKRFA